ncbi:hypothetical protein M153_26964000238, partial [Pseudoloma neurophilia]
MIEEKTIENEIENVDSEFQMGKDHDDYRISRMYEILIGKKFSVGNRNTFGTDYKILREKLEVLHQNHYNKMVIVIYSHL